jgi:phosphoglucosamine mutase
MSDKRKLFGTDGIRGVANQHPMTAQTAFNLGCALTLLLKKRSKEPKIVIGKDTRLSGYMIESALEAGITSMGGTALLLGPLPTPAVAYLIRAMRAHGGVMISASHNPYQDNGMKVFGPDGYKLDDAFESELELWMSKEEEMEKLHPGPAELGKAYRIDDAEGRYLTLLKTLFRRTFSLEGKSIVFDGANGAAYACGVKLFHELGAKVHKLACEPDGTNINAGCAQEDVGLLEKRVLETKSDLGIGVDGDADRLMLVDETGTFVSPEHVMFAVATHLKERGELTNNSFITTTMTNQALEVALKKEGITMHRAQVGDRYVAAKMKQEDSAFGGENSGHYLFLHKLTTADGLFSALICLSLLDKKSWKLSEFRKSFDLYPQKLVNIKVKEKLPLEKAPRLSKAIEKVQAAGEKRVLVRYSGTELKLRLMVEGPNAKQVDADVRELAEIAEKELG